MSFCSLRAALRIDAIHDQLSSLVAPVAHLFQSDFRVHAERNPLLLAGEAILETPPTARRRRDLQIQAAAVKQADSFEWLVGPLGLEPRTKGFTRPRRFRWEWTISSPPILSRSGVRDALACHQAHCSAQVVSAPSGGVPPTWLRVAIGRTVKVSLNSSRPLRTLRCEGTIRDESPALTN